MKNIIVVLSIFASGWAVAGETTCQVKGMHCTGCKEMVEGKLCDKTKFSTCDVQITDVKKEIGTIHLVTKEQGEKVDEKMVASVIEDSGYKLEKCTPAGSKKAAKSPKAS